MTRKVGVVDEEQVVKVFEVSVFEQVSVLTIQFRDDSRPGDPHNVKSDKGSKDACQPGGGANCIIVDKTHHWCASA